MLRLPGICLSVRTFADLPEPWPVAGRAMLLSNTIVLALIPITEHVWSWGRFLRGGEDFELSLLVLLVFCCLIFMLAQDVRHAWVSFFEIRRLFLRCKISVECVRFILCIPSGSFAEDDRRRSPAAHIILKFDQSFFEKVERTLRWRSAISI